MVDGFADMTPAERGEGPGHQARARRPDPRRRAWSSRPSWRPAASTRWRSPRPACARACSSPRCSTDREPPLFEDVRRASVLNLAAEYQPTAHTEHVADLALTMWDALRQRRPASGARAAVGGGDAARHRHGGRLRRPPQALALPDPQRRPAGLLAARDRADRPDRPLPPQGHARRSGSSRALAPRRRRGAARPRLGGPADGRAARALARPGGRPRRASRSTTAASSSAWRRTRTSRSPAGPPSARPTCSSSAFGQRAARSAGARRVSPPAPTVTSSRSETASTTSSSASSLPPSGSASQVTRIMPVATFSSPTTMRPQMTSPSSQPIRSRSNHDRCTRLAVPPQGQIRSWASLALQTACMFLAEASRLPRAKGTLPASTCPSRPASSPAVRGSTARSPCAGARRRSSRRPSQSAAADRAIAELWTAARPPTTGWRRGCALRGRATARCG